MKKTATLVGAFALSLLSFQSFSQVKLGVKAGLNVNSFAYDLKDSDDEKEAKDATKSKIGYHVGLAADFGITESLSLQTGLMWTNKGAKIEFSEKYTETDGGLEYTVEEEAEITRSLNYLEIPVNLAYKVSGFQVHAGPYVAFGVGGKEEGEYKLKMTAMGQTFNESESYETDIKFKNTVEESDFDDDEDVDFVRALDYGLNFGVGYMAGPVLLSANYSLGMGNLTPDFDGDDDDSADDNKIKNRVIGVSVTYFFGGE